MLKSALNLSGAAANSHPASGRCCSRGSLFDVLRAASASQGASLPWARRLNMALDAAKGMLALHSHSPPIIHRDLKVTAL